MFTLDNLPRYPSRDAEASAEQGAGLVCVWSRAFAPHRGSAAVVLRETILRGVSYVGRFRMYRHRYTESRARGIEASFRAVLESNSEVEAFRLHRIEHVDGWTVEVVVRCGLRDEAVHVMQQIVECLGLPEATLRRAS
jgi:hypothetical protein